VNKLVSIIIPAYNAANYIAETLESIIQQSYGNWECLVIDDGSVDATSGVAGAFAAADERVKYFYKENGGLCSARNYGLTHAKGDFIQYLDADDLLFKDKLELMVREYDVRNNAREILFCDFIYGYETDPRVEHKDYHKLFKGYSAPRAIGYKYIYNGWDDCITIPIHCFLFPTRLVKEIRFDTELRSKEDWNYHLNILSKGNCFFVPYNRILCSYRVSKNSMSKNYTAMITSSLIILHKWKKSPFSYMNRLAFYILQAYIYKLKRERIDLKLIFSQLKKTSGLYPITIIIINLLVPLALLFKIYSSLRIRIK
jgi:glycosyltransferase involved in cell wall biosynthesis